MSHQCKALVFRCMDFRITASKFSALLSSLGYNDGDYDLVSLAGSAKACLSDVAAEAAMVLKQIELSEKLHHTSEVVIFYHDNCGAYGIADPAEEHQVQVEDLKKIADLASQKFPSLKIQAYIIKGVPEGELQLEKVSI